MPVSSPLPAGVAPFGGKRHTGSPLNKDRIQRALALHVRGFSNAAIAEQVHCSERSVQRWLREYPELIDAEIHRIDDDPRAITRPLLPHAASTYRRALEGENLAHAVPVARDVMDRHFGKPIVRQAQDVRARIELVYRSADGSPIEFPLLPPDEPPEGE